MGINWRSAVKNIKRGEKDKFLAALYRKLFWSKPDGVKIPEEDWDYLIILDACRYDMFKQHHTLEGGELEKKISRGSTSIEFFNRNFTDYYGDIVYVSANGKTVPVEQHFGKKFHGKKHFHELVELYLEDDPYDDRKMTPQYILERAKDVVEEYPDKRIVVHIISPHSPYIGSNAPEDPLDIRDYRDRGYSWEEIKDLYVEDLQLALEYVEDFIEDLEGKIVVSSDHGEAFGEYGISFHPYGVYIKELIEVPWYVIDKGERPEIRGGEVSDIDL